MTGAGSPSPGTSSLPQLLVTLLAGWRPSSRLIGHLLVAPLLSVSLVAWLSGNPFNGTAFGFSPRHFSARRHAFSKASVQLDSPAWVAPGVALIMFGWTYPHFSATDSWTTYLYASPFGLLPCPTLSVVIGITLLFGLSARASGALRWSWLVCCMARWAFSGLASRSTGDCWLRAAMLAATAGA